MTSPAAPTRTGATAAPPAVAVQGVARRFDDVTALAGVSLSIAPNEFVSLLGPSGCGKTTLLRIIAGLERQDSGSVSIAGKDVSGQPPHKRPVNLVFQRYALFPHKTVADNVGFSLMLKGVPRREIQERVDAMLELVHLGGYGPRHIEQLSGGQGQRVALARALIDDPPVLLLDEPLAALDLKLRQAMQLELRQIQRRVGSTFIYVTHDQQEAFALSDRVVLMQDGHIVQDAAPSDVYHSPRTLFAATFVGEANIFRGTVDRGDGGRAFVTTADGVRLTVPESAVATTPRSEVSVCIRPERMKIGPETAESRGGADRALGKVVDAVFLGNVLRYRVSLGEQVVMIESSEHDAPEHHAGDRVAVSWDADATVVLED